MKKCCAVVLTLFAAAACLADKPKIEPYGTIRGDMYYADDGVLSWGKPSVLAAQLATGTDAGATGFTAQHSLLGLKLTGPAGDIALGGVCEADFFSNTVNFNAKPRLRLAYAWCRPFKNLDIRIGQQWDLFAPLNPATTNTNGNLWYSGNSGYRRPQMQARYGLDFAAFKQGFQLSLGEATTEDEFGYGLGQDNISKIPMIQGRMCFTFPNAVEVGAAAVYAAYGKHRDYATKGVSLDADLPLSRLLGIKGELVWGANLDNANLFSIGGPGDATHDVKCIQFWWSALSKPLDYLNVAVGFGMEKVTSQLEAGWPERNLTLYGDLIFPLGQYFTLSTELQIIKTTPKANGTASAAVIDVAGTVSF